MENIRPNQEAPVKKARFHMPHIYALLFSFIALMTVLTYIIPAGVFNRVEGPEGRMMIDPNSYHIIERTPVSLLKMFVAIPQGFVEAGWVVVLTFCVAGGFMVVKKTGIIEVTIDGLSRKLSKRGIIIIPVLMVVFALIDSFIGMCELTMVYVPIILPLVLMLGFDSITACAIALCGSAAGFTAALTNPFTIGIGQKIAGLPLYSGVGYRIIVLTVTTLVGIIYVTRYALKVRKNPELSEMYEDDISRRHEFEKDGTVELKATARQNLAGLSAIFIFALLIFGVFKWKWDMPEIGGMFVAMGVVSGLISGIKPREICDAFNDGCADVMMGAIIVGIARGIVVVMNQGQIIDTIIYGLASVVQGLPSSIAALGMLAVQTIFSFIVPSGSGMTLITMPIMAPIADITGITRQTAVLALQFADGISNIIVPTSGYFMAVLAIAKVPYEKWVKFMLPLFVIWTALGGTFLVIAQAIKWGPF
ncbi:MAG TPA: YfcC family protein [Negativicutes bacterium]|nr:YfcC family protein [Negativicutes bacterium]